jgi:hypothetical protein
MTALNLVQNANNSDSFPRTTENNEIYRRPMKFYPVFHVSDMQGGLQALVKPVRF